MSRRAAVARPPRWPVRLYNSAARATARLGWRPAPITAERALRAARRRTGLHDLGPGAVEEPLTILARSFETEAGFSPFGRRVARQILQGLVEERLKIVDTLDRHPEIRQVEIHRPLFIVGLPRTGTTLLYSLLAQDPAARPLLTWESVYPTPPPTTKTRHTDRRIRKVARLLRMVKYLVPEFDQVHELSATAPEEDQRLLRHTFVTWAFSLPGDVESYLDWLRSLDSTTVVEAYRFYRSQLQLLQWRCPGEHWVLKSPAHMPFLGELREVFPDACIIQTHRDPARVLPSACSLVMSASRPLVERLDTRRIGERVLDLARRSVEKVEQVRRSIPAEQILDVRYSELVRDPFGVVRSIYDHFGYTLSSSMEGGMREWLARNPRHKHGRHRYSLEQFGLDRREVDRWFEPYRRRYSLPLEDAGSPAVPPAPPASMPQQMTH